MADHFENEIQFERESDAPFGWETNVVMHLNTNGELERVEIVDDAVEE